MAVNMVDARDPAAPRDLAASEQAWPSPSVAYYTVFMMAVALMFAEIDRGAMSLLVQPIKQVYHLSDTLMGWLLGPFFALFYAACGIPTARFIDRYSRKSILAWALGLWSAGSVLCGLSQNYVQLAAARLFLGAAESPNGPAIFSIISDSFPRKHLTRGISLMQLGAAVGNGFSLLMTGVVIAMLMTLPDQHLAGIGVIRWWQLVYIAVGLPGILAALALGLTVKEPARHGVQADVKVSMLEVLRFMGSKWKIFGAFMGSSAISGLGFGVLTWQAAFYQRTFGWAPSKVGILMGVVSLFATLAGLFIGTWFYERLVKQGRHDAAMRVVLIGRLIALPAAVIVPLMSNGYVALGFTAVNYMMLGATGASMNSILQIISPNRMRGQITAIFFLFYNLIGQGFSPLLIGMFTDLVLHDETKLRYAILTANLLFLPTSLFVLWLGRKAYAREVEQLEAAEAAAA
jgi:MFS family permease